MRLSPLDVVHAPALVAWTGVPADPRRMGIFPIIGAFDRSDDFRLANNFPAVSVGRWPTAGSHERRVSGQPTWMSAFRR